MDSWWNIGIKFLLVQNVQWFVHVPHLSQRDLLKTIMYASYTHVFIPLSLHNGSANYLSLKIRLWYRKETASACFRMKLLRLKPTGSYVSLLPSDIRCIWAPMSSHVTRNFNSNFFYPVGFTTVNFHWKYVMRLTLIPFILAFNDSYFSLCFIHIIIMSRIWGCV
jgi:hypothetical protein